MGKPYTKESASKEAERICKERSNNSRILTFLGFVEDNWKGSSNTNIKILCSLHGESIYKYSKFHEDNCVGCHECGKNELRKTGDRFRSSKEEFIGTAKEIHGDKYNYNKVNYINSYTKIEIICPIHGSFWQRPAGHLKGKGCKECFSERQRENQTNKNKFLSEIEFINEVNNKFGENHFDFSNINYINGSSKIKLTCNFCGNEIIITPRRFLKNDFGCSFCAKSKSSGEEKIVMYLKEKNLNFTRQFFTNKIYGKISNRVFIDFALKINNQEYWIEFNGKQHYEYYKNFFNQSYQNFINQVNRD